MLTATSPRPVPGASILPTPPPTGVRAAQRPLRQRVGAAWACVEVLSEDKERGPCESKVCCRFCGAEFHANTERIVEHLSLSRAWWRAAADKHMELRTDSRAIASAAALLLEERTQVHMSQAQQSPSTPSSSSGDSASTDEQAVEAERAARAQEAANGDGQDEEAPPVPPCRVERDDLKRVQLRARQWLKDEARLRFLERIGLRSTSKMQAARIEASKLCAASIASPSTGGILEAAAEATAVAVALFSEAATAQWRSSGELHFASLGLGDADCAALADVIDSIDALPELQTLAMGENRITDNGFEVLVRRLLPPSLDGASNAHAFGAHLKHLSLFHNPLGDQSLIALSRALSEGALPALEVLDVSGTAMLQEGLRRSIHAWRARPHHDPTHPTTTTAVAALLVLRRWRRACDSSHDFGRRAESAGTGAAASASASTSASATAISRRPTRADNRRSQRIVTSFVGHGTKSLGEWSHVWRPDSKDIDVTRVSSKCGVGDKGVRGLADALRENSLQSSEVLAKLKHLRLFGNKIGDAGLNALVNALITRPLVCRNLEELWLQQNCISDEGLEHLTNAIVDNSREPPPRFADLLINLRCLLLGQNRIRGPGVEALGSCLSGGSLERLTKLSLRGNPISRDALVDLSAHLDFGRSPVEVDVLLASPPTRKPNSARISAADPGARRRVGFSDPAASKEAFSSRKYAISTSDLNLYK